MTSFLTACVAIALIGFGAHLALDRADFSSADRTADPVTVRLD